MISLWHIFKVFAKIGAFTIGGGIPMIAAIKSELVERKWLNEEDFIDIYLRRLEQQRLMEQKLKSFESKMA